MVFSGTYTFAEMINGDFGPRRIINYGSMGKIFDMSFVDVLIFHHVLFLPTFHHSHTLDGA